MGRDLQRLDEIARRWRVTVLETRATTSSLIAFGVRTRHPVVLKLLRVEGDEWDSGNVTAALAGAGMVAVLEQEPGAVLLERLDPGTSLAIVSEGGDDDAATRIISDVMLRLHSVERLTGGYPTVEQWGSAFDWCIANEHPLLPRASIADAQARFAKLCATQTRPRLLHGDLQHYNILADAKRGWIAIDPKGVVGELECELGPALRNPHDRPELYSTAASVERRLRVWSNAVPIDVTRTIAWAHTLAWLSVIWSAQDAGSVSPDDPALRLARVLELMVDR